MFGFLKKDPHMSAAAPISAKALTAPKISGGGDAPQQRKIKVLWYSDFLWPTGFGNVAEAILTRLKATGRYEFEVLGINHHGDPYNDPRSRYYHMKDVPVWPAYSGGPDEDSMFGYRRLERMIFDRKFDVLFVLQDTFNLTRMKAIIDTARKTKNFGYVFYFPVDGDLQPEWVTDGIDVADFPVAYTKYAKGKVEEIDMRIAQRLDIAYHGIDPEKFKPFDSEKKRREFRKEFWNVDDDTTVFVCTNRNQQRKDLPRLLLAHDQFCKNNPDKKSLLYLHCMSNDSAGFDLVKIAKQYTDPRFHERMVFPDQTQMRKFGFPVEMMGCIYAGADAVVSTTLGEGWGLMASEAMACKTPVILPDNTTARELVGDKEERGYLAKCGSNPTQFFVLRFDNDQMRPITDVEHLAEVMGHVAGNREEAVKKAGVAYDWIKQYTWDRIVADFWDPLFQKAYAFSKNVPPPTENS